MGDAAMWAWGPAGHAHVSIMSGQAPTLSRVEQRFARFLILARSLARATTGSIFHLRYFTPRLILCLEFSICYICTPHTQGWDRQSRFGGLRFLLAHTYRRDYSCSAYSLPSLISLFWRGKDSPPDGSNRGRRSQVTILIVLLISACRV